MVRIQTLTQTNNPFKIDHPTKLIFIPSGRQIFGGMSTIQLGKAVRLDLNRSMNACLKIPTANEVTSLEFATTSLKREVEILKKLKGGPSVPVAISSSPQGSYLVTKFISGKSIDQLMADAGGKLEWRKAVPLFKKIVAALGEAHQRGVLHLDLKPANILVADDGTVYIIDWGSAEMIDANGKYRREQLNTTPHLAAPEQLEDQEPNVYALSERTDIYQLMVLFHQMLTGGCAFLGNTDEQMLLVKMGGKFRPLPDEVPYLLHKIYEKSISADPKLRHRNIRELLYELEAVDLSEKPTVQPSLDGARSIVSPLSLVSLPHTPAPYFQSIFYPSAHSPIAASLYYPH